jgi:signal transduction histidine kinase
LTQEIIARNKSLAELAAVSCQAVLQRLIYDSVANIVTQTANQKNVKYCMVVKHDGEVYVASDSSWWKRRINDEAIKTKITIVKDDPLLYSIEPVKTVVVPVIAGPQPQWHYTLWLGFSLKEVDIAVKKIIFNNFGFGIGIIILGLLVAFYLARNITKPIKELVKGAKGISDGNLDLHIEVNTKDEIGNLAYSFNQMAKDLKKSRNAIEEYSRNLEQRIDERTRELKEAQAELVEKEKLAAVGALAAGVAHELRNSLGAVNNAVYYIKDRMINTGIASQNPRILEFLNIMEDEITNTNKIINDLLSFSKGAKPTVSLANINDVIEESISVTEVPDNIEVVTDLNKELPEVMIDREQVRQVFLNIILNAVHAMPSGGKITIRSFILPDTFEIGIEFIDTGCGMNEETLNKIFEPFFTTKAKGIGLGLAISKGIIERHEGKIEVKSQVGKGTTFIIKLPVKEL